MNSRKIIKDTLDSILYNGAYSNIELNKRLSESDLNDKDKGLVTEVVYGTIKYKKSIDYIISTLVADEKKIDKRILNILRSAIYQIKYLDRVPDFAVVNESVNLGKKISMNSSRFINGVLRNFIRNKDAEIKSNISDIEYLSVEYSFEPWMVKLFLEQFGREKCVKILSGLNSTPSVTVRVNSLKSDYDEVFDELNEQGYTVEEGNICPEAINIIRGKSIENNPLFIQGKITVQDESAMLVAPLLELNGDLKVLDLCSAPGGKTTHIAELLDNKGTVIGCDIYDHKLKLVEENKDRLGIENIQTKLLDAAKYNSEFREIADRILVDAPCSGLGIIRKKPEIKWTKSQKDLKDLVNIQRDMLKNAWLYLKPDGIMVYSTCTLNKKENEENIKWIKENYKDVQIEKIYLGESDNVIYNEDGSVTILPNEFFDGFYIAKLRKLSR
ncbi:16S rRNA (cytosine(967)-C(5))-methyltransferase RsmB [Clostridium folliculivorans]|uniref:16S rRNA (cytosine(967)-C(5))-methyltransferase n=1 Tax=Clostridium folliculivorans TaxID=2886038 RepID=A0A9W5Y1D9_9CLOT|nr:16S rRNA (cytosine(967)-C(5))-methyltransferase RsmB [Clostridium folliculivorans]GKU24806.1 ribosomal RNA small subunit methyltransferase B [Clostridium folliculivorans]GKU30904.1 ribosomal RNA small subunit methyltransferase B [Clostridium folliculivorans]